MSEADVITEIQALDRAWEDAIVRADAGELDRLGSDELVYTHADSSVEGKASFIDHIIDGARRFLAIRYEDIEVRVRADAAILTCALHLDTIDRTGAAGALHFRMTHVWCREDGAWRLLASQSTHLQDK